MQARYLPLDSYKTLGKLHYLPGAQFFLYKIKIKYTVSSMKKYYRNYVD